MKRKKCFPRWESGIIYGLVGAYLDTVGLIMLLYIIVLFQPYSSTMYD